MIERPIKWIDVNERLPHEDWIDKYGGDGKGIINDFLVVVENNEPLDDPEVCIADYTLTGGFMYHVNNEHKYNGDPWRVTWWAIKPELPITLKKKKK